MKNEEKVLKIEEEKSPQIDWLKAELAKLDDIELPEDFEEGVEQKIRLYEDIKSAPVFGLINEDEKVKMAKTIAYLLIPLAAAFVLIVALSMNSLRMELDSKPASAVGDSNGYVMDEASESEEKMEMAKGSPQLRIGRENSDDSTTIVEDSVAMEEAKMEEGGAYDSEDADSGRKDVSTKEIQKLDQKLIYRAFLNIEIENKEKFNLDIRAKLKAFGGYVESVDEQIDSVMRRGKSEDLKYGSYTLRVPAEHYEELLLFVQENAKVTSKNETVQNVTSEYRDIEQNVKNLELKEETLRTMMKDAKTVDESLAIFELLSETRSTIDSLTTRLKSLDKLVSYSTIEVNYQQKEKKVDIEPVDENLGERISNKFNESLNALTKVVEDIIVVVTGESPVYLVVFFLILVVGLVLVVIVKKVIKKLDK